LQLNHVICNKLKTCTFEADFSDLRRYLLINCQKLKSLIHISANGSIAHFSTPLTFGALAHYVPFGISRWSWPFGN